jgi:hypothetical protein
VNRTLALATPLIIAVPLAYGAVFWLAGHPPLLGPLAVGALGWLVALALRAPIALVALRLSGAPQRIQPWLILSSGPLEEGVRVAVVLFVGRDLSTALWIGLGWAAVEVLYSIVNGVVVAQLAQRTDPEAEAARALLPPAALAPSAPLWGIVERTFATALHVGFTLIVAAMPLAAIATAIVHSAVNVTFLALLRRLSMATVMASGVVVGAVAMIVGLAMHGAI